MSKRSRKRRRSESTREEGTPPAKQHMKAKKRDDAKKVDVPSAAMVWSSSNSQGRSNASDVADPVEQYFDLANAPLVAYTCQEDKYSVRVKQNATIEDSTGGIVWESAYLVAAFVDANREQWLRTPETKSVLEVGAGCGLLGLTIAHITAGSGVEVVLTETPPVTDLLAENVQRECLLHDEEDKEGDANECKLCVTLVVCCLTKVCRCVRLVCCV
jgi:hypothetical protein